MKKLIYKDMNFLKDVDMVKFSKCQSQARYDYIDWPRITMIVLMILVVPLQLLLCTLLLIYIMLFVKLVRRLFGIEMTKDHVNKDCCPFSAEQSNLYWFILSMHFQPMFR